MRAFIAVLVLVFSLQSLTKADDIRDFEIEGMSIGDSLLDYMNKNEIQKEIESNRYMYSYLTDKFGEVYLLNKKFENYEFVSVFVKSADAVLKTGTLSLWTLSTLILSHAVHRKTIFFDLA